jgi:hypothetical protein
MNGLQDLLGVCWGIGSDRSGQPIAFVARLSVVLAVVVAMLAIGRDASAAVLPSSLIAYWNLNEASGSAVNDTALTGVASDTITLASGANTPTWIAGRLGGGLRFDGNDYANIPNSTDLNIGANQMSISMWVNLDLTPPNLPGAYGPIYDSATDCYNVYLDKGSHELRYKVMDVPGRAARPGISETILPVGSWHQVTAVYDGNGGTKGTAKIYWDGVLKDTHNGDDGGVNPLSGNVKTGQVARLGNDTGATYYSGALDDIGIWKDSLTDGEVMALYGLAGDPQLGLELGKADQLFGVHDTAVASETLNLAGLTWQYATGLGAYALGTPTRDVAGNVFLRLDAAGTGVVGLVPEPGSLALLGLATLVAAVWLPRRRQSTI